MNQVVINASSLRNNIYQAIREVAEGLKEYVINLKDHSVVMIAKDEYDALKETAEILSIPGAMKEIEIGRQEIKKGEVVALEDLE